MAGSMWSPVRGTANAQIGFVTWEPQTVRGRCNFYLTDGAHLPDPSGLLQGSGKNIRHIKIYKPDAIPLAGLKQLIREGHRFARLSLHDATEAEERSEQRDDQRPDQ